MVVKFLEPIADANQFPAPIVPATPKFRLSALHIRQSIDSDMSEALFTRNGRGAIGIAGTALKNKEKNIILIPSFHCPALVEPFIYLNYQIHFYPVNPDLTIDIEMLKDALKSNVTHCVVVRYFGFSQNNQAVIKILQEQQIKIIEDCAHSLFHFNKHFNRNETANVDASICSINKILPTIDGGALFLQKKYEARLSHVGWVEEIKACAFLLGIPQLVGKTKSFFSSSSLDETVSESPSMSKGERKLRYFQPIDLESASYRHTKLIFFHSALNNIRSARRQNFEYLVKNIDNPSIGKPLFTELTDDDVPYVTPFLLKDKKHFSTLRKQGIQILRWEEVATSECETSQSYRSCLVQIPCHQQLTREQLDFIVTSFNELLP